MAIINNHGFLFFWLIKNIAKCLHNCSIDCYHIYNGLKMLFK